MHLPRGRIVARMATLIFVAGATDVAAGADWSVAQMSGRVTIAVAGAQAVALKRDTVLHSGGVLRTGAASRALLMRNTEAMSVGPNAAIAIPGSGNNSGFTTILQNGGVVTFNVDKRNVQHFSVETPYLAAVVKGTEFSVEVTPAGSAVRVNRGVVEVTALRNGYSDEGAQVAAAPIGVSTGSGGIDVDAGVAASASTGPAGIDLDAGPVGVSAGSGGIAVDVGPIHLGLGR